MNVKKGGKYIMKLLQEYKKIEDEICEYFSYDGERYEIQDCTECYWKIIDGCTISFALKSEDIINEVGVYYEEQYKGIYEGKKRDYTLVIMEWRGIDEYYMSVFDNEREI